MNRIEETIWTLTAELPRWGIRHDPTTGGWVAQSPSHAEDGIEVRARTPVQLVERVRALCRVVAAGKVELVRRRGATTLGRPHPATHTPDAPQAPREPRQAVGLPSSYQASRTLGFTGNACPECGAMQMVRNGSCEKCMSCGSTSGCS